ncbi:MAG: NHLP bacteriocin system secretion protein [Roseomonas sp.]|nr:NHLP bacteriocin system secretion protein [Roseomonas sp.]
MSGLYRQQALDAAAGPSDLHRLVRVTPASAWAALAAVTVILAAVLAWSILGSIPTVVKGQGLLLAEGGQVHEAVVEGSGAVEAVLVTVGSRVAQDEVVARVTLPELNLGIAAAREVAVERQADLQRVRAFSAQTLARQSRAMTERRAALAGILASALEREAQLTRRLAEQEDLLSRGNTTRPLVLQVRTQLNQTSQDVADARNQVAQLDLQLLDLSGQADQRNSEAERLLADARRQVEQLEQRLARQREVRAPAAGRVTEVRAPRGAAVRAGEAILTLEDGSDRLEVIAFLPPQQGRRVRAGMPVRVSPSTARWEEFGAMIGEVTAISEFPATREGMMSILRNGELVTSFSRDGAPYMARIALEPDAASLSGYRWSSARGSTVWVASGTLATTDVRVQEQAPITLVLPLLREISGIDF